MTEAQIKILTKKLIKEYCCCNNGIPTTDGMPTEDGSSTNNIQIDPVTGEVWYWDNDSWELLIEVEQGLSMGSPIKLGDDAAGTTEPGVLTSTRYINLNGHPVVFVGEDDTDSVDGVKEARITITPEGVLEFNKQHFENQSGPYYIRIYPNDIENVATFNFTNTSNNDIQDSITRNLESFVFGWNVAPGGTRENSDYSLLGISMEYNWDAPGLGLVDEWHILHTPPGVGATDRRPISFLMVHDDVDAWGATVQVSFLDVVYPGAINDVPFYKLQFYNVSTSIVQRTLDPVSQTGVIVTTDVPNKTYKIENVGMGVDSIIDGSSFAFARFDMMAVGTQEVPLADLTVFSKIAAYIPGVTSGGSPIGASLYLGDFNYYSGAFYDKAPGISAVYNASQAVASDLAFYAYDGARTEKMRLLDNGCLAIGTVAPNANAILDVVSTTKAFMPPRMTTGQKNAIPSPTAGMVVYDSTLNKLCVYTTAWETITSA